MVFPYPMDLDLDPMMVFPYPMDLDLDPMMVFPYPMDLMAYGSLNLWILSYDGLPLPYRSL